jgi:hypothetical protein
MNNKRTHKDRFGRGILKIEDSFLIWFPRQYELGWEAFYIGEMRVRSKNLCYGTLVSDFWAFTEFPFFAKKENKPKLLFKDFKNRIDFVEVHGKI